MPLVRLSLASVPRGSFLACVGGWTVLLHVVHLVLLAVTATPAHRGVIVASTAVWVAVTGWGLARTARMTGGEMALAISCGALAITADGIWGDAPFHPYLVSSGLLALVLALGALSEGRALVLSTLLVTACQAALLGATLGGSALGVYVTTTTTLTTNGACFIVSWVQRDLRALVESTNAAARRDPLTGLQNRRGMAIGFPLLRGAAPEGHRVAAVVLDLDHFKAVNDTHGHDVGDQVLVHVAGVLRTCVRSDDLVVRLGGEELAWLGAWASAQDAVAAAEQVRHAVATAPAPLGLSITTSVGVAFATDATHASPDGEALSRLLVRADTALYEAKRTGRDRVVLAPDELPDGADPHRPHDGAPAPQVRDGGSVEGSATASAAAPGAGQRA